MSRRSRPLPYFVAQQSLAELEDCPHGEGQHQQVDVPVAHGKVLLADVEHLPDLAWKENDRFCVCSIGIVVFINTIIIIIIIIIIIVTIIIVFNIIIIGMKEVAPAPLPVSRWRGVPGKDHCSQRCR